jgi:hypothetical protein
MHLGATPNGLHFNDNTLKSGPLKIFADKSKTVTQGELAVSVADVKVDSKFEIDLRQRRRHIDFLLAPCLSSRHIPLPAKPNSTPNSEARRLCIFHRKKR